MTTKLKTKKPSVLKPTVLEMQRPMLALVPADPSVAIVQRGQTAWRNLKASAAEQRQWWREVGEALLVGRRLHPSDNKFKEWCDDMGFGDMDRHDRADAMWLMENGAVVDDRHPPGMTHPHRIRQWFRDSLASQPPSPALDLSTAAPTLNPADVLPVASRVVKLAAHAKGTGPEAETAKRYLDKHAARFNTTADLLIQLADKLTPEMKASPQQMEGLVHNVTLVKTIATELVGCIRGTPLLTREFITATINAHFDQEGL